MNKKLQFLLLPLCLPFLCGEMGAQEAKDSLVIPRPLETHVLEGLKGTMAGVEVISSPGAPGMTPTVYIRGMRIIPDIEPLYIVDGMRTRSLDGLDPGQIEQIEVLKDASAMALYGADGAAGVLFITTRRAHRKGFHAGYRFEGATQALTAVPERWTLSDWEKWYDYTTRPVYSGSQAFRAERSFMQHHMLDFQYGGEKVSAYAGVSWLDNDGPAEGLADTHRRYAAAWSAAYRPFRWMSFEVTGYWNNSAISRDVGNWLNAYLVETPSFKENEQTIRQRRDGSKAAETAVQLQGTIRPLPGLCLKGNIGYSKNHRQDYQSLWDTLIHDVPSVFVTDGHDDRSLLQWGLAAGYAFDKGNHHVRTNLVFRGLDETRDRLYLSGEGILSTWGLDFGDDGSVREKFLLPAYGQWKKNGAWPTFADGSFLSRASGGPGEIRWKEGVLSLGYDWKGRYQAHLVYHQEWTKKNYFDVSRGNPAVTLGWNISQEPFVRRLLPEWFRNFSLKASWAEVKEYLPVLFDYFQWMEDYSPAHMSGYPFLDAHHRDLTADAAFSWGRSVLKMSFSWYIHDDDQNRGYREASPDSPGEKTVIKPMFTLRNQGGEFLVNGSGSQGDFKYALAANLTLYRNHVTMASEREILMEWAAVKPFYVRDGACLGIFPYKESGSASSEWAGGVFPTITGGFSVSFGYRNWQATVAGHGNSGQKIKHDDSRDALTRHYMEKALSEKIQEAYSPLDEQLRPDRMDAAAALFDGSFFRIDQIRLDYSFPLKGSVHLTVYGALENGFLWTKYPGTDPEMSLARTRLGVESAVYPSTRRTVFGVSVAF